MENNSICDGLVISLLFSGGRDSSLACSVLARQGYHIHLLTFNNGATASNNLIEYRISELQALFPKQIIGWERIPSYGLFKKIALSRIEQDFQNYKINLICLGCKLAMHTKALQYSISHDINILASGNTKYQSNWSEQNPVAINILEGFCKKFGVEYINPIYNLLDSEDQAKEMLYDMGFSPKALEATCLFGSTFSDAPESVIIKYLEEKIPLCEEYLRKET